MVIVLGFLTLITVLVVAFFSSVTTNAQSSNLYVRNVQTQQLAESAVSIAMSQIKDATTQGPEVTWISQPGMIRTFNSGGAAVNSYRLYSSSSMKLGGSVDPESEVGVIQRKEWASYPAHMVDLNKPARDATGNLVYPILDPRAADAPEKIEGYEFNATGMGEKFVTASSPAPMPVRWLYILAKGDIVNGLELDRTKATFAAASKDNPVVGRIAFWTDDESCKVNINTAAGDEWNPSNTSYGAPAGSYWDMPHTNSAFDRQALANYQPAQGEYQRYPGHPATTYLSAVFPALTRDDIGRIVSRVEKGGSEGGTSLAGSKIVGDANRLYASVDELIFDPERKTQPVTKERLEKGRFFLTAHSRAPEANLFNLPRIAIWPIHRTDSTARRTAFDRLIAFCSTIGPAANGQGYYIDRADADSPAADFAGRNVILYRYLQRLTDRNIPGYGGKITGKYPAADRDQILTEIFDYIRSANLYDDNLAAGQQFTDLRTGQTSVNAGHGQVAPLHITAPGTGTDTMGFGRFYTISEAALQFICTADPTVADSNIATGATEEDKKKINRTLNGTPLTEGQRRIETMLLLELFSPSQGWTGLAPNMQVRIRGLDKLAINGTALGFPADATMAMTNNGTSTYHGRAWGGNSGFRFTLTNRRMPARGGMPADAGWTSVNNYPFIGIPITITVPDGNNSVMNFTSGSSSDALTVEIYSGSGAANQTADFLVQTLKMKFPNGAFPVPMLVAAGTPQMLDSVPKVVADATTEKNWWSFARDGAIAGALGRIATVNQSPGNNRPAEAPPNGARCGALIRQDDVVRSILPNHGDYRLIAGRRNVPQAQFAPHPYYTDTGRRLAHSLLEPVGYDVVQGADYRGTLVEGAAYGTNQRPDVMEWSTMQTRDANSQTRLKRGDFDTGMTTLMDGAYINKPDEGNNYRGTGSQIPYFDNNQAQQAGGDTFFSPNRQMPSPVMFGSLPTGLLADSGAGRSWRTLLFRPDASASATGVGQHDGSKSPKDYLLLDLFWMPVVEPYAISEPFSTAGKINLNCQVAPFTYIKRTTALRALLKSERLTAIPTADAGKYKGTTSTNYRNEIDADETLKQFTTRFGGNKPFRSAGEICELYLVPKGQTVDGMPNYWNTTNRLTGDNLRERPYATLYPRLTTKSNIYSVHFCVQTLRQVNRNTSASWNTWDEHRDVVTGEYRGTTLIERYVDLQDNLPDFADSNLDPEETLDKHCKLRVLMTRKFAP